MQPKSECCSKTQLPLNEESVCMLPMLEHRSCQASVGKCHVLPHDISAATATTISFGVSQLQACDRVRQAVWPLLKLQVAPHLHAGRPGEDNLHVWASQEHWCIGKDPAVMSEKI